MKYTILIALLGAVSARHHHHHSLAQVSGVNVPLPYGSSDVTFVPGKAAAAAVVAQQQAYEAKKTAEIAAANAKAIRETNALKAHVTAARVDQVNNEVYQNPYYTRRQWTQRPPPALAQLEDNESDKSFQKERVGAAKTVATQQSTEAKNVASITSSHAKAAADTAARKADIGNKHRARLNEFLAVYIPDEDVTLQM